MTFVSYSQNFEDVLLWRALHDVGLGRYLDIGAQDPEIDSMSLAFYRAGWRGTHVEPVPVYAEKLRTARPDEQVIQAAVTDAEGPIRFFELGGLSSGREDVAQHHANSGFESKEIYVPTVRLDTVLTKLGGPIHWMKIDVEGMEGDVLRSWGSNALRPWILVIESTFPNSQEDTQHLWIDEVLRRGYEEAHWDGLDRFFVHETQLHLKARLSTPPNVFDRFQITKTHFTAVGLLEETRRLTSSFDTERAGLKSEVNDWRNRAEELGREAEDGRLAHRLSEARAQDITLELEAARRSETEAKSKLDKAHTDHVSALASLAAAAHQKAVTVDTLWRERAAAERTLRDQHAETVQRIVRQRQESEQALRDRHVQAECELSADLATWRATAEQKATALEALQANVDDLRKECAALEQTLSDARASVRAALAVPQSRWQRIGRFLRLSREDGARLILSDLRESLPYQFPIGAAARTGHTPDSQQEMRLVMQRAYSLDEMLGLPSAMFVPEAYKAILGRDPDPEGLAFYNASLSRGRSRVEILRQLVQSAEAQKHGERTAQFRRAIRRKELRSIPLFGLLFSDSGGEVPGVLGAERSDRSDQRSSKGEYDALASRDRVEQLASDVERLRRVVDGMGSAIEGLAETQLRHEQQLRRVIGQTSLPIKAKGSSTRGSSKASKNKV